MFQKIIIVGLLFASSSASATTKKPEQQKDPRKTEIMFTHATLNFDRKPKDLWQWVADMRTSEEGQAVVKAVCEIYDVPPAVVDYSTKEFWSKQLENHDKENDHNGILRAPPGYEICKATRKGEISITGGSSLTVSIWRYGKDHGLGWYAAVPDSSIGSGGEQAKATYLVMFVKSDPKIWNKHKAKCDPAGYVIPAVYIIDQCDHGKDNCKAPYRYK